MKCKECKYRQNIANTSSEGKAICGYQEYFFPVALEDDCHYIPKETELKCIDCWRYENDLGCATCQPDDSAIQDGELCDGYEDKREEEFEQFLMFWKVHGIYDRKRINKMLDDFEDAYEKLTQQNH